MSRRVGDRPALPALVVHQRILGEGEFGYYPALQQVFLDDSFKDFRRTGVVPNAFGVDDCDGALCAHAKAICFCAIDQRGRADKI